MDSLKATNTNTPMRILHVDDDPSILEITKLMLQDINSSIKIDQAGSADEAYKKMANTHYDAVVSDYEMPQKDGLHFLKELRDAKNDVPFILFTGKGREEVAINALNLGANGYFNKQGSPETVYGELAYGIQTCFGHRKADELLRKSQAELNAIVNNAPLGIATSDSNMRFKSANEAFCRIVGYSEDELQKRSFRDITYPDDVEVSDEKMKELICGNILYFSQEKRYVRKDGGIIDGKVTVSAIRDGECKPVLFVAELEDITQQKQAEAELRRTFEVLERAGEGIDAGLAVIGKDYRVVWANKLLMDLGVAPNKKCYQTFNHSEDICVDCGVKKIFEQNVSLSVHEYKTINRKGETIWIELRATPLKDPNGITIGALELAIPITERKQVETALKESEEKYRSLFESTQDGIVISGNNGVVESANQAAAAMFGITKKEELLNMSAETLYADPQDRSVLFEILTGKGPVKDYEVKFKRKDGTTFDARVSVVLRKDLIGNIFQSEAIIRDISERKEAKKALIKSESNYRMIVEKSLQGIVITQTSPLRFVFGNESMGKMLGYSSQELISLSSNEIMGLVYAEDRGVFFKRLESRMRGEPSSSSLEFRAVRKDGSIIWMEALASRVEYNGQFAVLGMFLNIDERKRSAEILRQSEERYRELGNSLPNIIFESDVAGHVEFVNDKAIEISGISKTDLEKGLNIQQFIVPEDRPRAIESMKRLFSGGKYVPAEYNFLRKDGTIFPALISTTIRISQGKVTGLRGLVTDITDIKKVENKLRESEMKYREFAESLPQIVFETDSDGKIVFVNQRATQITGYSVDDFGKNFGFVRLLVPEEIDTLMANVSKLMSGEGGLTGEFHVIRKDGSVFPAMIWASPILVENKFAGLRGLVVDISENKEFEKQLKIAAEELSLLNEKLKIVGSLTRHDVGNKLMVAKANLYLLKKRIGDNPDLVKYLDKIDSAFATSDEIFEFSRLYDKIGSEKLSKENVFESFNQAVAFMPNLGDVKVVNECKELNVIADSLLKQLFYNFIDNSLKHGKRVTQIRLHYAEDAGEVKLFYEDNGVGVPKANKPRLFEAGFSTGKGSGLGLYLVKKMMDVYGWTIAEEGEEDKGAKFVLTIKKN